MLKKGRRPVLRKSSMSGQNAFQVMDRRPQNPEVYRERAEKDRTSQRNAVFLYRKLHITASGFKNSSLHKVARVWGQHSHSHGVKLTPQLDEEKVWVCACRVLHTCKHVHMSVCVGTAVFLQWHIFPYSSSKENWVTPTCVDNLKVFSSKFSCYDQNKVSLTF